MKFLIMRIRCQGTNRHYDSTKNQLLVLNGTSIRDVAKRDLSVFFVIRKII